MEAASVFFCTGLRGALRGSRGSLRYRKTSLGTRSSTLNAQRSMLASGRAAAALAGWAGSAHFFRRHLLSCVLRGDGCGAAREAGQMAQDSCRRGRRRGRLEFLFSGSESGESNLQLDACPRRRLKDRHGAEIADARFWAPADGQSGDGVGGAARGKSEEDRLSRGRKGTTERGGRISRSLGGLPIGSG